MRFAYVTLLSIAEVEFRLDLRNKFCNYLRID